MGSEAVEEEVIVAAGDDDIFGQSTICSHLQPLSFSLSLPSQTGPFPLTVDYFLL